MIFFDYSFRILAVVFLIFGGGTFFVTGLMIFNEFLFDTPWLEKPFSVFGLAFMTIGAGMVLAGLLIVCTCLGVVKI